MSEHGYDAQDVLADVAFLADHWDDLLELRQPGTPRPWRQALLDPERKAAQAARDLLERAVRDPDAPGFTSAPQHVEILDVIVEGWVTLDELAEAVLPYGPMPAAAREPRVTEIDGARTVIATWLAVAAGSPAVDHVRVARIARRLARLVIEVARAIGLVLAGQLLAGAVCPFCKGFTPKQPAGAAITMRVEEIAPAKSATKLRPAVEGVHAVVCWNPLCDPDSERCGTRYRGRPAWPWHEWEWLAPQLIIADPPVRLVAPIDYDVVPIDHARRSGIDRRLPAGATVIGVLDGVRGRAVSVEVGTRVRFEGGPFHNETRAFVRLDDVLAVVEPDGVKPQLRNGVMEALGRIAAAVGHPELVARERVLGAYRLAVEDPPRYVWRARNGARSA